MARSMAQPLNTQDLGRLLFEARVLELRTGGMDDDHVARQIVDDHFRATGESLHDRQNVVELLVSEVP